jgi:hypothetical protein
MKKRFLFGVGVAAFMALCHPAQAIVIIPSTEVTFNGITNGVATSAYQLDITYDVTFSGGLYEYDYNLVSVPAENIYSFSLGGQVDPIDTAGLNIINYGGAVVGASGFNSDSVAWAWGVSNPALNTTVSFTSPIGPQLATFTVNDDDIAWTAPPPIPAPVPEPSTLALLSASAFVFGLAFYRRSVKQNAEKAALAKLKASHAESPGDSIAFLDFPLV